MDKALLYCMQIITIFVTNYFLFKTVKCGNGQA